MDALEVDIIERGKMMKKLMATHEFKVLIMEEYIRDTSIDVGTSFDGSAEDVDTLKAISHLSSFMQSVLVDAEVVNPNTQG